MSNVAGSANDRVLTTLRPHDRRLERSCQSSLSNIAKDAPLSVNRDKASQGACRFNSAEAEPGTEVSGMPDRRERRDWHSSLINERSRTHGRGLMVCVLYRARTTLTRVGQRVLQQPVGARVVETPRVRVTPRAGQQEVTA
jgi:hypothetical protein